MYKLCSSNTLHSLNSDPTAAILSLQSAIRTDPGDAHAWEGLADAYRARGSYSAAMKAYDKARCI